MRSARSSTSRPSRWQSPSILREPRASSFTRWSIAGTDRRRRTPRETSRSSAAGRATWCRPRRIRRSSFRSPARRTARAVTGDVIARFFDLPDGVHSAPIRLASLGTPQPYHPADLAQTGATLTWHTRENYAGQQDAKHAVPRAEWAFADCESTPWPGRPDPSRICVKDAFRANRFYELVYTAKDPLVLGVGLAATRDIVSFFRHAQGRCVRHAESSRWCRRSHDQHRRLTVRQFHPHVHSSRLQPGHAQPYRVGRRVSADRGAPDADQPALRAAGRCRRHVRARQRRRRLVDAIRGQGAWTEGGEPSRSLRRDEDLPEDRRSIRVGGIVGTAHVAGFDRHRCERATSRCRRTSVATTIRARRMAAGAAASRPRRQRPRTARARCRPIRTRRPSRRAR